MQPSPESLGKVAVEGQAGLEVRGTVVPVAPPARPIDTKDSWFAGDKEVLAAAPATGGGSLALLEGARQFAERTPALQ